MTFVQFLYLATTAIVAGAGAYFGSYLKKKGENLATQEDIHKLVNQVRAVTEATKIIEAKISNDMWERQRRWEFKKDTLFETMKELAAFEDALNRVTSTSLAARASKTPADISEWRNLQIKAAKEWEQATLEFGKAKILMNLVCGTDIQIAFTELHLSMLNAAQEGMVGNAHKVQELMPKIARQVIDILDLVREELDKRT